MVSIEKIESWVFRAPIDAPVANAFGSMHNRPALFVRIRAGDGAWGWGEVFCNFPQVGAEHRARLLSSIFAPLLEGFASTDPVAVGAMLAQRTRRMAIQCGEPGPFAQIAGAIDQALWDLAARRAGLPLWKFLDQDGRGGNRVRVYASGIGPLGAVELAIAKHAEGYRAFKLKVGFESAQDRDNLGAMRAALGAQATLMVDANMAWTPDQAPGRIAALAEFHPLWVEEPIAADEPAEVWRALAAHSPIALAAGENMRGAAEFDAAIASGIYGYVQPDVGKWGGLTGCREVARRAAAKGVGCCPHWLAGGIGMAASLQLRAAMGADGYAEVDANPNPLREEVMTWPVVNGWITLPDTPGLGVEPDLARLARFAVKSG